MSAMSAYGWDLHDGLPQQFAAEPPSEAIGGGSKRSRQTYSKYQTAVLETVFQTSKYIVRSKRQQMSAELSLTERQIKIWFQNRRMKEKKCGGHKEVPLADDYAVPELGAGYRAVPPPSCDVAGDLHLRHEDAFVDFCRRPAVRHRPPPPTQHHDATGGYAGYGSCGAGAGYDLLTHHEADAFAAATKQHHWAPAAEDYDQDFFGDHDLDDHFQRLPTAHHHHHLHPLMNSQVQDYCPPQLQAAHGY